MDLSICDMGGFLNSSLHKIKNVNSTINLSQIRQDIKTNNFEYKTSDKELNVFFSLDNKSVGISLDKDILKDLKSFFNKNDFLEENGKTILKGDAANYVAGWFSEIAFDLNYLESDSDNNGVLNSEELMNTLIDVCYFDENKDGIYVLSEIVKKDKILEEDINEFGEKNINTISKMINNRIFFDKDKDGEILVKEQYIEDENEYFKNLNQAKEELKDKKEKIEINPKLKEYAINEENNHIRKLKQDIKLFKNSNALKINEDKEKELKDKNTLEDFCEFSIKLIDELKDYKLLDLKA
ncbi:hypothetical protein AVANS_0156 [Campylobacter sp. RM5004]|uniref:hypothetical protein n=2 Tax=unclassified Campylobacter TaxID=2593542 RepID=UPI001EFBA004|nr:hypothetical protein [Campylobacter sp. RM5004]ULO00808.1 hypothetical protein AVANS_0156 [Campylobacter sp. RM5004]